MRVKLECPVNFLSKENLFKILSSRGITSDNENPEIVIVNPGTSEYLDWKYFRDFKSLKIVGTPSTGTNHIDIEALSENNIKVVCLLDDKQSLENIHASAEFTWLHIMNLCRKFTLATSSVSNWRSDKNEKYLRSRELYGKTIGIIGMGRIGNKISKYANAFGLDVLFYDPYVKESKFTATKVNNLSELVECDIISINCILNKETKGMISKGVWDKIRSGTIVVNTSRGEVVDEDYICNLIKDNGIVFGSDVLENEQDIDLLKKSPLLNLSRESKNVVITPHVAGATSESQTLALVTILDLARRALWK